MQEYVTIVAPANLRSVGHITGIIRQLEKWKKNRKYKDLDVKPLETSIRYLEEYRELVRTRVTKHSPIHGIAMEDMHFKLQQASRIKKLTIPTGE